MKKKIGIDLDKTLFDCKSVLYTFLNSLSWNREKKLKAYEIDRTKKCYKSSFANKIFKILNPNYYFTFPNSVETLNKLSELGFEVHIVSNRPKFRSMIALTLMSLENSGLKYDKLVLGCNNKHAYAQQEGLDYFIDNVEDICDKFLSTGKTKPLCFSPKVKDEKSRRLSFARVEKISTWGAIGDFFTIEGKRIEAERNWKKKLEEKVSKTFIARGLCLPEPSRQK